MMIFTLCFVLYGSKIVFVGESNNKRLHEQAKRKHTSCLDCGEIVKKIMKMQKYDIYTTVANPNH